MVIYYVNIEHCECMCICWYYVYMMTGPRVLNGTFTWNHTCKVGIFATISIIYWTTMQIKTLQCRHNERDGVSHHQPHHCLLNRLFRHRSKKTPKLRVTGLWVGNSPVNSPHKGPVTRKMFPFDDVIMNNCHWCGWCSNTIYNNMQIMMYIYRLCDWGLGSTISNAHD